MFTYEVITVDKRGDSHTIWVDAPNSTLAHIESEKQLLADYPWIRKPFYTSSAVALLCEDCGKQITSEDTCLGVCNLCYTPDLNEPSDDDHFDPDSAWYYEVYEAHCPDPYDPYDSGH